MTDPGHKWSLRCGDGIAGLRRFGMVDHALFDPPFSAHVHANHRTLRRDAGGPRAKQDLGFRSLTPQMRRRICRLLADRVRGWSIVLCDFESLGDWKRDGEKAGLDWVRSGIWRKPDGSPQISGDRPAVPGEAIAIMHARGRKRWNGGGKRAEWTHCVPRTNRRHPTQKPLRLITELLLDFTTPGEIVADAFAGSGTTGVAALRVGCRFVGWELDKDHARVAERRIRLAEREPQIDLFRTRGRPRLHIPDNLVLEGIVL